MDPTRRFSGRVEDYVRYRPGYPGGVLGLLRKECGLLTDSVVADVGSGTGILARMFVENGNRVFGVEPNDEMRLAAEKLLGGYTNFTSVPATAEATTLEDGEADFVTAGQAFHWFEPEPARKEFARVLDPRGWVVLVWNERRKAGTPFLEAYEHLIRAHGTDYAEVSHGVRGSPENVQSFFAPEDATVTVFENRQLLDLEGLRGRLLSSSYVPGRGEPGFENMVVELRGIFEAHEESGKVALEYETRVYCGRLGSG